MSKKNDDGDNPYQDLMKKLAAIERENRTLKKLMDSSDDKMLSAAAREASASRSAPVIMDPDRDYIREVLEAIANRTKGLKDPEFQYNNGQLLVIFDDLGPKYKLKVYGPIRRMRYGGSRIRTESERRQNVRKKKAG